MRKNTFLITLFAACSVFGATWDEVKQAPRQVPDSHPGLYELPDGSVEALTYIDDTTGGKWGNKPRAQYNLHAYYGKPCRHCTGDTWIYDFTITVPSDNYGLTREPHWNNNPRWNVFELHPVPDGGWAHPLEKDLSRSVCLGLHVAGYQFEWIHGFDHEKVSDTWQHSQILSVTRVTPDVPVHWRVEYKVDPVDYSGKIKIWRNGKQILSYRGLTCTNDDVGPYALLGIYVWKWSELPDETGYRHVIFHDFSMWEKK